MIVANHLKTKGAGFQGDTNVVTFLMKEQIIELDLMSKDDISYEIFKVLFEMEEKNVSCH